LRQLLASRLGKRNANTGGDRGENFSRIAFGGSGESATLQINRRDLNNLFFSRLKDEIRKLSVSIQSN
jgi:hypothetical protein